MRTRHNGIFEQIKREWRDIWMSIKKMFSRSSFNKFSLSDYEGTHMLRPDRILGAFVVNQSQIFKHECQEYKKKLLNERKYDFEFLPTN